MEKQNCIALYLHPSLGLSRAGIYLLPVPAEGVPVDILDDVSPYLTVDTGDYRVKTLDVTAPTWAAVKVAVEGNRARVSAEKAEKIAQRAKSTATWRERAAAYLAGASAEKVELRVYSSTVYFDGAGESAALDISGEEVASVRSEEARRGAADRAEKRATILAILPRVLGGEGQIEYHDLIVDGRKYGKYLLTAEEESLVRAEATRRDIAERVAREAAEKAHAVERATWIAEHGSERLKKCVAQGFAHGGIYDSERLAHDLPGWELWSAVAENKTNSVINPDEASLDALIEAKAKWPQGDVRLLSVWYSSRCDEDREYTTVLMMVCPWDADDEVLFRL